MRIIGLMTAGLLSLAAGAATEDKFKFEFNNAEVSAVLKEYSEVTGQKFLIDPDVKGKITIMGSDPVTAAQAFSLLSTALASNGYGISTRGDWMKVGAARNIQRSHIPVVTELPALEPEAMYTWVFTLKNVSADEINKQVRILTSRDGEITVFTPKNQLIISDWSPNLQRIAKIMEQVDVPGASSKNKTGVSASALPKRVQKPSTTTTN